MNQVGGPGLVWLSYVNIHTSLPYYFVTHESDLMVQKGCPSHCINIPARKKKKREGEGHILEGAHPQP